MTSTATRTDTAWREIAASPRALYAALTEADAVAQWLPPTGMTATVDAFEARTGGAYCLTLHYDEAPTDTAKSGEDTDVVKGEFVRLIPNERVVQRVTFDSADPAYAGAMTITWRLDPVETGTRVTVTAENVPVGIRKKDHLDGLRSTLENLAGYLAG